MNPISPLKKIIFWTLLALFFFPSFTHAFISCTELIENAKDNDLKVISLKGEVIGDIFYKSDFAWINVSDGINAIGVWVPKKSTEKFSHPGDYTHRGDFIQIRGKFHRTCSEHTGEIDIHAEEIIILKKGEFIRHSVGSLKIYTAVLVFFFAMILFVWEIKNEPEG